MWGSMRLAMRLKRLRMLDRGARYRWPRVTNVTSCPSAEAVSRHVTVTECAAADPTSICVLAAGTSEIDTTSSTRVAPLLEIEM